MSRLNVFGLIVVAVLLIPNVGFAAKCKDGFENRRKNKGGRDHGTNRPVRLLRIYDIPHPEHMVRLPIRYGLCRISRGGHRADPAVLSGLDRLFRKSSVFRALALSILLLLMGSVEEEGDGAGADVRARDRLVADGQALPLQPRLF